MSLRDEVLNRVSKPRSAASKNGKPAKKSNRFTPINAVVDCHLADLAGNETKVFLAIWRWVNSQSGLASISHSRLSEVCGLNKRTVIRAVNTLIDKKLIRLASKGSNQKHEPNKYQVTARM